MKKLMFAAVAMAACVAMADGEIASDNIVGYTEQNAGEAFSNQVVPFDIVGNEGADIQSLIPVSSDPTTYPVSGYTVDLQVTDGLGYALEQYFYLTTDDTDAEGNPITKEGWYNDDLTTFSEKVFARGEGFILNNSTGAGITLKTSGEVTLKEVDIPCAEAFSNMGNFRAIKISIQDFKPIAPDPDHPVSGYVYDLQVTDSLGYALGQYFYLTTDDTDAEGNPITKEGWYNDDLATFADCDFNPGEGFILNNSSGAESTIRFAEVKLEKTDA